MWTLRRLLTWVEEELVSWHWSTVHGLGLDHDKDPGQESPPWPGVRNRYFLANVISTQQTSSVPLSISLNWAQNNSTIFTDVDCSSPQNQLQRLSHLKVPEKKFGTVYFCFISFFKCKLEINHLFFKKNDDWFKNRNHHRYWNKDRRYKFYVLILIWPIQQLSLFLLTVTLALERIISGGIIGEGELCCELGRARWSRGKLLPTKRNQNVQLNHSKLKRGLAEKTQVSTCRWPRGQPPSLCVCVCVCCALRC